MLFKKIVLLMGFFIWAFGTTATAQESSYKSEYSLSIKAKTNTAWGQGALVWAQLINQNTNGRIKLRVYPAAILNQTNQTDELGALQQGAIDLAIGSALDWATRIEPLNLFALPFLLPDFAAIDAVTQGVTGQLLFDHLTEQGLVPLAWGENGYLQLSNSIRAVHTPTDLKDIRVPDNGSAPIRDTLTALGVKTEDPGQTDAASQTIDAQLGTIASYMDKRLYEKKQKFLSLWNYAVDPLIFAVNRQIWESWSVADQQIVQAAAITAARQQVILARQGITNTDNSLLKHIKSLGVELSILSPAQIKEFATLTQAAFDKWVRQIGQDLVNQAQHDIARKNTSD